MRDALAGEVRSGLLRGGRATASRSSMPGASAGTPRATSASTAVRSARSPARRRRIARRTSSCPGTSACRPSRPRVARGSAGEARCRHGRGDRPSRARSGRWGPQEGDVGRLREDPAGGVDSSPEPRPRHVRPCPGRSRAFDELGQFGALQAEGLGQALDVQQADVARAPLDVAEVGPVDARPLGELLPRQARRLAPVRGREAELPRIPAGPPSSLSPGRGCRLRLYRRRVMFRGGDGIMQVQPEPGRAVLS